MKNLPNVAFKLSKRDKFTGTVCGKVVIFWVSNHKKTKVHSNRKLLVIKIVNPCRAWRSSKLIDLSTTSIFLFIYKYKGKFFKKIGFLAHSEFQERTIKILNKQTRHKNNDAIL